jgi:hypothetical protein
MNTKHYEGLFKELLDRYCLFLVNIMFVDNVSEWCKSEGYDEPDKDKPLKLIADEKKGCRLVINEIVPEKIMEQRINALSVRSALLNVAKNRADMLNSDKKKLAYLFLSEYASTLPELADDEIMADTWALDEMEKKGFFKE